MLTTRRLFIAILFIALFVMATRDVTDPDFGWHLRTGEFIVTTFSIPHTDLFSFTATGQPWVTHEWLVEVVMYLLYRVGGFGALTLFFAFVATLTFALVYWRSEGQPYLAAFVVLFAAATAAPFWGARPHTLSLLLASSFLFLLDRYQREGATRHLLWLLPLMLLWANSHGSFALGPALIAIYLGGDALEHFLHWSAAPRSRRDMAMLAGVGMLCVALIAVNPNGVRLYTYPFETLASASIQTYIQEWQPPDFTTLAVLPFLVLLVATIAALILARRRIGLVDAILLLGFTYYSLRAARQISIWVLIAAPIFTSSVNQIIRTRLQRTSIARSPHPTLRMLVVNWALVAMFALAAVVRIGFVVADQSKAEREFFPVDAVNFIEAENLAGPIFNQYNWGGYLIWRFASRPRERVFIDGRSDVYGLTDDLVVREYLKAYTGSPDWREPLDRYAVRVVLIEPDAPLASQLARDVAWQKVYEDKQAVVWERR